MYYAPLHQIMQTRGLRAAHIAKAAGISRAAVGKWMRQGKRTGWINVETSTLRQLAQGLGMATEAFLHSNHPLARYTTTFLWDALYPTIDAFVRALRTARLPALARLTQVVGLHEAAQIVGRCAITKFPRYKHLLKPARCRHLELLWPLYRVAP